MDETAPARTLPQPETRLQALACDDGPTLAPVLDLLHRVRGDRHAWLTFHREHRGAWQDVGAVRVDDVCGPQPWLPELLAQLGHDAYVSVNTMFRAGVKVRVRERDVYRPAVVEGQAVEVLTTRRTTSVSRTQPNGLAYAHRDSRALRWLNAAWVDCDGHAVGLDVEATVAAVMRAWHAGVVPVPTFLLLSGRGVWPFWQLVDERNPAPGQGLVLHGVRHVHDTPLRASRYAARVLEGVNRELARRLAPAGADSGAVDLARVCRVPGSVNTKADVPVTVLPVLQGPDFALRAYTLSELADSLGVLTALPVPVARVARTLTARQAAQRLDAYRARYRKPYEGLVQLEARRGGFAEGCRSWAVFYLALCGLRAGVPPTTVEREVRGVALRCQPPMSAPAWRAILANAHKQATAPGHGPSYATLARHLDVTADERASLPGLRARDTRPPARPGPDERRRVLRWLVATQPAVPSTSEAARLLGQHGHPVSANTVKADYRALDLVAANAKGGRPPTLF